MSFDTGDNTAKGLQFLRKAFDDIGKKHGATTIKSFTDNFGCFAKYVKLGDSRLSFILVARTTKPFKGCISSQREIVDYANKRGLNVILAYLEGQTIRYYQYNPEEILKQAKEDNERLKSKMINYPMNLGKRVYF